MSRRVTLIEAEGKILRLEVDAEATGTVAGGRLTIFVDQGSINLTADEVERARGGLTPAAPLEGSA